MFLLQKTKEEPTSVYSLCHRRTKGAYSISLCKPDSSWVKYRHQGLAYRQVCHIRSYRDLYTHSARIRVRLCAEKLLNASVCAQFNPVSSSTIERRNNGDNGRPAVSWQRRVPQWRHHWFLPEVSKLFLKSWEMRNQRRSRCWICVTVCLETRYLLHKSAAAAVAERCHIFSSFFFKQLTRRDNAREGSTKDV